MINS
jgi:hypothetical protein